MSSMIKQGILEWVNRVSHRDSSGQWDLMLENSGPDLKNKKYIVFEKKCDSVPPHILIH